MQLDKKVLTGWSLNDTKYNDVDTLLKYNCKREVIKDGGTIPIGGGGGAVEANATEYEKYQCGYLFANIGISDVWVGLILLVISLTLLSVCLVCLVKILNSLMENQMAGVSCYVR